MAPTAIRRHYPVPDHPEFSIIRYPGYQEYRLENRNLNLNHDALKAIYIALRPLLILPFIAVCFQTMPVIYSYPVMTISFFWTIKSILFQVSYESVVLLPPHGIQLETHRGFSRVKTCTRRFIPNVNLQGAFINEGLNGWNIFYYLAVVKQANLRGASLELAYQNLLPRHSILLQTFEGIIETILSTPLS